MSSSSDAEPAMDVQEESTFENFNDLPKHLQFKTVQMMDTATLKNFSAASTGAHNLAQPSIKKRLSLKINLCSMSRCIFRQNDRMVVLLASLLANVQSGRRYDRLQLFNFEPALIGAIAPLALQVTRFIGQTVTDLEISSTCFDSAERCLGLLKIFSNVQKLRFISNLFENFDDVDNETLEVMPNLRELVLHEPEGSNALPVFKSCNGIQSFSYEVDGLSELEEGELERFLIQLNSLKHLKLIHVSNISFSAQPQTRLESLESLSLIRCSFDDTTDALAFFRRNQSIKKLEFRSLTLIENAAQSSAIVTMLLEMPNLEEIIVDDLRVEGLANLSSNQSVKKLSLMGHSDKRHLLPILMTIFPRLEKIFVESPTLTLDNFSCRNLYKLESDLKCFKYQPSEINEFQQEFEIKMKCFFLKNPKIKILTLGHANWIPNKFSPSIRFCRDILKFLPDLKKLEIYNPSQISFFVSLLIARKKKFKSVTIFTTQEGKAKTNRNKLPGMKIVVV